MTEPLETVPGDSDDRNGMEILASLESVMVSVAENFSHEAWKSIAGNMARQLAVFREAALEAGFSPEFGEWMARAWAETTILKPVKTLQLESSGVHVIMTVPGEVDDEEGETEVPNED